jgi:hypothetical protein
MQIRKIGTALVLIGIWPAPAPNGSARVSQERDWSREVTLSLAATRPADCLLLTVPLSACAVTHRIFSSGVRDRCETGVGEHPNRFWR